MIEISLDRDQEAATLADRPLLVHRKVRWSFAALSKCTTMVLAVLLLVAARVNAQQPHWRIDPKPTLILGGNENDTTQLFAVVVGATRLANGNILVADRAAYSLHLFGPDGKHLKTMGRKGAGPGEFVYLGDFWRCGDSLVAYDIDGHRESVLALDGRFVRGFRFATPEPAGQVPYRSACNSRGTFVHSGWGNTREAKPPSYRPSVDFWLSGADSTIRRVIGRFPGSERFVKTVDKRVVGTRPLPLGKQTDMAIGLNRIYIGTAERPEILVFGVNGERLPSIQLADMPAVAVTRADIDAERDKEVASSPPTWRKSLEDDYATFPYPKFLPPYVALRVDAGDNLWVQSYPRKQSPVVTWTVFNNRGSRITQLDLPRDLEPFEIGSDYVLGRYLDPDEAIPQVRLYRLVRGP